MKKTKEPGETKLLEALDVLYDKTSKTYSIIKVKYNLDEVNKDDIVVVGSGQALTDYHLKKEISGKFLKINKDNK